MPSASSAPTLPFLERLLDGEKVEWKTLGEVGAFVRGTSFQKKHFVEKGVGCIHYGEIYTRYSLFAEKTISYLNEEIANKARKASYGDLIIATTSENDDDVCKSVAWLGSENIVVSNDACYYHHTLDPKYVAYFFRTDEFQRQKRNYITGTKVKRVNANDLAKITIPIPPLRVQSRIVEILDKFTQLEAELKAELKARNKQYDFYRNRLLDFAHRDDLKGQVEWKTLGEVAELVRGNGLSKKDFSEFGVPAIHYGQIYTYYGNETEETLSFVSPETAKKLQKVYPGNIVITNTSENVEDVCKAVLYSGNVEAVTGGHATIIRPKDYILPKYLVYYTLTLDFFTQKKRLAKGAKVIDVSAKDLAKIVLPLPPLSEQRRIVEILDRFDTLTNSISEGLPREIALRRKQYEYYRDALLRFPQPAPTA